MCLIITLENIVEIFTNIWKFTGENASEIIAFSALGLAVWQGYIARRHNKLSVRPYLTFSSTFLDEEPHFTVDIKNNGLGTAIITDYKVLIDGATQEDTGKSYVIGVCRKLQIPNRYSTAGRYFNVGDSISAGESQNVIKIVLNEGAFLDREISYKELERIQFKVKYKCLYGVVYESVFHST
jgi:hypothetical protein